MRKRRIWMMAMMAAVMVTAAACGTADTKTENQGNKTRQEENSDTGALQGGKQEKEEKITGVLTENKGFMFILEAEEEAYVFNLA